MKRLKEFYLLGFIFILASCLPQEKVTQCGDNEAYNATSRSCVATLGATSTTVRISSVSPSASYTATPSDSARTHLVTVSDAYNNGYSIVWQLTQPNGTVTTVGTGSSLTFNHSTYSAGTYILEVQLYDTSGITIFDTRSWTVNITADSDPYISAVTSSTFSTYTTSAATTIDVSVINADTVSYDYQWYVNGNAITGESGTNITTYSKTDLDFDFDPTSNATYHAGNGVYSVQLVLTENGGSTVFDTYSWTVINNVPAFASVSLGTSQSFSTTTPTAGSEIVGIVNTDISSTDAFLSDVDSDGNLDSIDFCVVVDEHEGIDSQGVYVDFLLDGVVVKNTQFPSDNSTVCLGDSNNDGSFDTNFQVTISSSFVYEQSATISAVIYDEYSGSSTNPAYSTGTELQTYNWTITKRTGNTPPVVYIDETNSSITSCTYSDSSGLTSTTGTGCEITQDSAFTVAIDVTDSDTTDPNNFDINFFVDNTAIDGSTPTITSSDCTYAKGDGQGTGAYICTLTINSYDSTSGPIDSTTASYTITANVTDTGSDGYGTPSDLTSNTVTWTISTVNEANTSIALADFDNTGTGSYIAQTSATSTALTIPGTELFTEGDQMVFSINVTDSEADSFEVEIKKCVDDATDATNNSSCNSGEVGNSIVSKTITNTDGSITKDEKLYYTISEADIQNASNGTKFYQVTVTEVGTASTGNSVSKIVGINIADYNPYPNFQDTLSPVTSAAYTAFTGFPMSFDAGTVTDDSNSSDNDGTQISYQWIIRYDSDNDGDATDETWTTIDGATTSTLVWTPGSQINFNPGNSIHQLGTATQIKLCIGDDGWDHGDGAARSALNATGDDCRNGSETLNSATTYGDSSTIPSETEWNITVFSNTVQGHQYVENSNQGNGQIAVWVDPRSTNPVIKYLVYQDTDENIVLEKIMLDSNGNKLGTGSTYTTEIASSAELAPIVFDSTSAGSVDISYLSIAGDTTNDALYISYMAEFGGVDSVHVRRIDISGGKVNLTHDGKFGYDLNYDGLLDGNIVVSSSEIATPTVNVNGLVELDVQSIDSNTTVISFVATSTGASTVLTEGTDFCTTGCSTTTEMANSIVDAINNSTDQALQGFTASQSSDVVTLHGIAQDDFLEIDINATAIGQIMVNSQTGKWELPFINNGLSGSNKNKISILHDDLGQRLDSTTYVTTPITTTVAAQEIVNDIAPLADIIGGGAANKIFLATRTYSTGEVAVFEIDTAAGPTYTVANSNTDVFTSTNINNLKITTGKLSSNSSAYLIAQNNDNNEIAFARFDNDGSNYDLTGASTSVIRTDLDSNFTMFDDYTNIDLSAGANANDVFIGGVKTADQALYIFKVSGVSPAINCNNDGSTFDPTDLSACQKIAPTTTSTIADLPIAMSEVLENVTVGTDGDTTGENTKDIMIFGYHNIEGALNAPTLSIINVDYTQLDGDTAGANKGNHYNLPYVAY